MFADLITHIQKFAPLTQEEQEQVVSYLKYEYVNKKQHLFSEGDVCHAQYFVVEGCLRMYFVKDSGVEQIVQFGIDNWWISDYTSFSTQKPSQFYIQAVQSSKVIVLTQQKQDEMLDKVPKMERYFRILSQNALVAMQRRMVGSLSQNAEEKYHKLVSTYPDIVQRVPQHMIASYLGITPETVSRIRKNIAMRR